MTYKLEYAICSLIILSVVAFRFFIKRRFPTFQNRLFSFVLIIGLVDIVLDIFSSILIQYVLEVPFWLTYFINTVFYGIQILFPIFLILYTVSVIKDYKINKKLVHFLSVPCITFELFLLTNIFHKLIFYIDVNKGYVHNIGFQFLYISAGFYMLVALYYLVRYKKQIRRIQYNVLFTFIWIILLAMVAQYLYPEYLLTGMALTLAIAILYFTLQNPYDMLDSFTKTFNTEAMQLFLKSKIEDKNDFQFIVINIDGMRRINNLFGALTGNEVMLEISQYLHSLSRTSWLFKLQGTQFVVMTFNLNQYHEALQRITERFNNSWLINDMQLVISVNIRHFNQTSLLSKSEDVMNLIDRAFNRTKLNQENMMVKEIHKDSLLLVQRQLEIEVILRKALENDTDLTLYYQPIYSPKAKRFTSMEALIRCTSQKLGDISPAEFIPIAEKSGLILKIDEFVMNKTLAFISQNNIREELGLDTVEINLSAAEFINQGFYDRFMSVYNKYEIDPNLLIFEVTETVATISYEIMIEYMQLLMKMGIKFAIDDFGKGYANLTQVLNLPFNIIKLDRSILVSDNDEQSATIFEDILMMFKKLGKAIVVEGVETSEEVEQIIDLDPDFIQGFYYCKPLPEKEVIEFLKKANSSIIK